MIQTLKASLLKQPQLFIPSPIFKSHELPTSTTTTLRFIQATPKSNQEHHHHQQQQQTMDHQSQTQELKDQQEVEQKSTEDVMSHSFGQGYKTRSDEEGFGGIYGGNQSEEEEVDVVDVNHVLHPDYDKSQGSEVKEKEKARNQMEASS